MSLLRLPPPEGLGNTPVVICCLHGPVRWRVEPAGKAYHALQLVTHAPLDRDQAASSEPAEESASQPTEQRERGKAVLTRYEFDESKDYYEILGLGEENWQVSNDTIRKAYRQLALRHHPDKKGTQSEEEVDEGDEQFKIITEAYEVLSDPVGRRAYDSWWPFDGSIPTEADVKSEGFFEALGPVFERNSKWSVRQPAPQLGNMDTSNDDVDVFYKFWLDFKSWREFAHRLEQDTKDAESREERRWMERQNAAEVRLRRKNEGKRILKLVDLSHRLDPRLKQRRDDQLRAKKEAKIQREKAREAQARAEQQRLDAELARKEKIRQEEQARQDSVAREQKQQRDKQKKVLKDQRRKLRNRCQSFHTDIAMDDLQLLCTSLTLDRLRALCALSEAEALQKAAQEELKTIHEAQVYEAQKAALAKRRAQEEAATANNKNKGEDDWTFDEITMLAKAVQKVPGGTKQRWVKVAEFMGTTRPPKQLAAKAETLKDQRALGQAVRGADKQAYDRFAQEHNARHAKLAEKKEKYQATPSVISVNYDRTSAAAAGSSGSAPAPSAAQWTAAEQTALEKGLKTFPGSLRAARWERIAEGVPGRDAAACKARFKELVQYIKQKKKAQQK